MAAISQMYVFIAYQKISTFVRNMFKIWPFK